MSHTSQVPVYAAIMIIMLISVSQMDSHMDSFLNDQVQAAIVMLTSVSHVHSQMGSLPDKRSAMRQLS